MTTAALNSVNNTIKNIISYLLKNGTKSGVFIGKSYNEVSYLGFLDNGYISLSERIYHDSKKSLAYLVEWRPTQGKPTNLLQLDIQMVENLYNKLVS